MAVSALVAVCVWFLLTTSVVSFLLPPNHNNNHCHRLRTVTTRQTLSTVIVSASETGTVPTATTTSICTSDDADSSTTTTSTLTPLWLDKGLILSSFTDGLKANPTAVDWLMNALVESLWEEEQHEAEIALKESNLASPCNGPDPVLLHRLEETDKHRNVGGGSDWKKNLQLLCDTKNNDNDNANDNAVIRLRFLYIPTAMYALRPGSTSKPGKQRGRNRADGKKRRNEILRLLQDQLEEFVVASHDGNDDGNENKKDTTVFSISTVSMDFDDASVKQPEEVVVARNNDPLAETGAQFPETGKQAIREWKPHFIYVQGGNTFWLHHCMEKGNWTKDLTDACFYNPYKDDDDDEKSSPSSFSAVYCGVSAGAILAGESMQTACWKEWDDPSVVPGKETYQDWTDIRGLDGAGRTSLFPHMTEEWQEVAEHRTEELLESTTSKGDEDNDNEDPLSLSPSVRCIRDDQAYVVDGRRQTIAELIQ